MGENMFKEILDGIDIHIVVNDIDKKIVYKNFDADFIYNLSFVSDDIYMDIKTKKQYQRKTKEIGGYKIDYYHDVSKFLRKELSLEIADENVIVRDDNGKVVYNNMSEGLAESLKPIGDNIYFDADSNSYFQKHVTVSEGYKAEVYHDVTKLIEKVDEYTHDGLTGLPTRTKINEYLNNISNNGSNYIFAMMDIDNFKSVNDTYGHPVGDEVLKKVASVITGNIRGDDFAGRYGGEEFILIFKTDDMRTIMTRLDFIRIMINSQFFKAENFNDFSVSVSIGVCEYNPSNDNVADVINMADKALYYVKQHGKNAVSQYAQTFEKTNVK